MVVTGTINHRINPEEQSAFPGPPSMEKRFLLSSIQRRPDFISGIGFFGFYLFVLTINEM